MKVRLNPFASPILRGDGYIQFGTDAHISGVIGPLGKQSVLGFLSLCELLQRRALSMKDCTDFMRNYGLQPSYTQELLGELHGFGVVVDAPSISTINLGGYYPFAREFAPLARSMGMHVVLPDHFNDQNHFLSAIDPADPYIHFYDGLFDWNAFLSIHSRDMTVIPVSVIGHFIRIGPMRFSHQGPCLSCFELYRRDADPEWIKIRRQYAASLENLPVPARLLLLSHTLAVVSSLLGFPDAPGVERRELYDGLLIQVAVDGSSVDYSAVRPHPTCVLHDPENYSRFRLAEEAVDSTDRRQ
ncbi:MAG: hypothetical protein Q3962_02330 [Corynebacterium sp.]|nr:hypothetical protein [Corynebacterium sp.]